MTDTNKVVIRCTHTDTVFDKGKHRRIIVELGGGKDPDLVRFRLEGLRDRTDGLSIKSIFWTDFKRTTTRRWMEANEKRKAEGRRRLKKPKFEHA